jgi:hypothetical protein
VPGRRSQRERCELCERDVAEITRHHLIPQTRHSNRRNKRDFERSEVRGRIAMLCRPCHGNVHATFSNKELERRLNTVEALRAEPAIERFTSWIQRRPDGTKVTFSRNQYR